MDPQAIGAHLSINGGISWTSISSRSDLIGCFISKNGQIIVLHNENEIFVSSNNGASFNQTNFGPVWPYRFDFEGSSLCASNDGSIIYVVDWYRRNIYKSTNYGINWTTIQITSDSTQYITSIACSSNGSKLLATGNNFSNGKVFVSNNSGENWSEHILGPEPVAY